MRTSAGTATVVPSARAAGRLTVPGDKSISHRYAMLAALAEGVSRIHGYSTGTDCLATLACIRALGIDVDRDDTTVVISGRGLHGLAAPDAPLDANNSGTTLRLMSGILAAQPFRSVIAGDASLNRRPMERIVRPLTRMGAQIESAAGRPPLTIQGGRLTGIEWTPDVPSAQVKSCVLLAGLFATGQTAVLELAPTRDHTERALETFGSAVHREGPRVSVTAASRLQARTVTVPGDVSGAAFWCALAAGTPGGDITIEGVGLNPTRTSCLDLFRRAGAGIEVQASRTGDAEPVGTIRVRHHSFESFSIEPGEVPGAIDEIPALAALGAMMGGGRTFTVRGARELRVKESDRISMLVEGFRGLGAAVEEFEDGFSLTARQLRGGVTLDAGGDHRIAMAFIIAATRATGPVTVENVAVDVSYPGFFETLQAVTGE